MVISAHHDICPDAEILASPEYLAKELRYYANPERAFCNPVRDRS